MTRPRLEEKLTYAYSLTLGQVANEVKDLLPPELQQRLRVALAKRNFLAHHFWFERIHMMCDEHGLLQTRQELLDLCALFDGLDDEIAAYFKPKYESFGITEDVIARSLRRLLSGEPGKPLMSHRRIRKQERIVRVWDVQVGNGQIMQVFETDDGCLWQLCDIGLGWTCFEKPAPNWVLNQVVQKYLPATINPRPSISEPWTYGFPLAKAAILWVKPGKRNQSYTWGVTIFLRKSSVFLFDNANRGGF